MKEKEKENNTPLPQPEKEDPTTGMRAKRGIRSLPALPDSDPLFQRGFVIGGRGFNRPRLQKDSR